MAKRWISVAVAVVVGFGGMVGPDAAAQSAAACPEPYQPVWAERFIQSALYGRRQLWPEQPTVAPSVSAVFLDLPSGDIDTDGDGSPDDWEIPGGTSNVVITRGADRLTLTNPRAEGVIGVGDMDGDGGDEVLVIERFGEITFLVPSATPAGTYELADVGIRLPSGRVLGVGDQDGDGRTDLLAQPGTSENPTSVLVDGPDALAPGAGGQFQLAGEAGTSVPGFPAAAVDLGDVRPAFVALDVNGQPTLTMMRNGQVTTWVVPDQVDILPESVSAVRIDGRTFLVASASAFKVEENILWDIEEPCRALPAIASTTSTTVAVTPAPLPGTAPAARPVVGRPRFTG